MSVGKLVYNDSSHSYWLDGKRVKSASKVAQIAADGFAIEQYGKRMVAIGMTLDQTFRERIAVDLENKTTINDICQEAANTAKANGRAQRGVQRHRVFELGLLGEQSKFITDQQKDDWKVLERTLDRYGLTPMMDRVEQFVAWPENGVVGRYDAYLGYRGAPALFDLKGGENAVKYPHSTAVQLWLYRNAPHTSAAVVKNGDKSEVTEWTTHPEDADPDFAYVIYCDDHHNVGELWQIDLSMAETGGRSALRIVDWRKSWNYGRDIASQVAAPVGSPDGERPSTGEPVPSPVDTNSSADSAEDIACCSGFITDDSHRPECVNYVPNDDRRLKLRHRYDLLNDEQKADYTARKQAIDTNDLDAVERLLDEVEPFNIHICVDPNAPPGECNPTADHGDPDEGPDVDDETIAALQREFERLSDEAKFWIASLTAQGRRAGVDWRPNALPSLRRFELARGIVKLSLIPDRHGFDRDDITRSFAYMASEREEVTQESLPLGAALGTLDHGEAARFAKLVDEYASTGHAA